MAGGFRIEVEMSANRPAPEHRRPTTFEIPGVMMWTAEPAIAIPPRTVIIGHLFKRGPPRRRVEAFDAADACGLAANDAQQLLRPYWGGYVLVHAEPEVRSEARCGGKRGG